MNRRDKLPGGSSLNHCETSDRNTRVEPKTTVAKDKRQRIANMFDNGVATVLANWCTELRSDDLSNEVLEKAENCLLDAIASAIPGRTTDGAKRTHAVAYRSYRQGPASIWFTDQRLCPTGAAFANSASVSMLDIDDGNRSALGHPGAAVVPAAVALVANRDVSGVELLTTIVAGYEACLRIGMSEVRKSYHTGNWSSFGACVAVARLLGMSSEQLAHALGATAYHGPRVADLTLSDDMGSNVKESIPWSVVTGMTAADLASEGFTGCRDALDIKERFDPAKALEGLGSEIMIMRTYFKRYSACRWIHSAIEGLLAIMDKHQISVDEISEIEVETFLQAASLDNLVDPTNLESAQYSLPYCLGLAAALGESALMPITPRSLHHPEAVAIANKVTVHHAANMDSMFPTYVPAHVSICAKRGTYETLVLSPWGEPNRAPDRQDILNKFYTLAENRIAGSQAARIVAAIESLRSGKAEPLLNALRVEAAI